MGEESIDLELYDKAFGDTGRRDWVPFSVRYGYKKISDWVSPKFGREHRSVSIWNMPGVTGAVRH